MNQPGRSLKGLAAEYGVSKASISNWTKQFREECQTNETAKADYDFMKENFKLKNFTNSICYLTIWIVFLVKYNLVFYSSTSSKKITGRMPSLIVILNLLRNCHASHASRRAGSSSSSRPSSPKDFSLILSAM